MTTLQQRNGIVADYSQDIIITMCMQAQLKRSRLSASSDQSNHHTIVSSAAAAATTTATTTTTTALGFCLSGQFSWCPRTRLDPERFP